MLLKFIIALSCVSHTNTKPSEQNTEIIIAVVGGAYINHSVLKVKPNRK
jgi:hypothetical protein